MTTASSLLKITTVVSYYTLEPTATITSGHSKDGDRLHHKDRSVMFALGPRVSPKTGSLVVQPFYAQTTRLPNTHNPMLFHKLETNSKVPLPMENLDPHIIRNIVPWTHEPVPRLAHDQFSRFCKFHWCAQQTDHSIVRAATATSGATGHI